MNVEFEDIDDLLAEVEDAIAMTEKASSPCLVPIESAQSPQYSSRFEADVPFRDTSRSFVGLNRTSWSESSDRITSSDGLTCSRSYRQPNEVIKCAPIYLSAGSVHIQRGLSPSACDVTGNPIRRGCDQLRCTACDFAVLHFSDQAWCSSATSKLLSLDVGDDVFVDYMFFRNYVPNRDRLGTKLLPYSGASSYCCQCSWVTLFPADVLPPPSLSAGLFCIRHRGGTSVTYSENTLKHGFVGGNGWKNWSCGGHVPSS